VRKAKLNFLAWFHEREDELEMHIGVDVRFWGDDIYGTLPILKIVFTEDSLKEVKVLHEAIDENAAFEIVKMVKPKAVEFLKKIKREIEEIEESFENAEISEPVKKVLEKIAEEKNPF